MSNQHSKHIANSKFREKDNYKPRKPISHNTQLNSYLLLLMKYPTTT